MNPSAERRAIRGRTAFSASCLLVLLGCSAQADPEPPEAPASSPPATTAPQDTTHVGRISCAGLEISILQAEPSRAGLRSAHGAPDSVTTATEPNRHMGGAIDSLFTVFYPGLTASFRTPPSGRDLISSARITDNRYVAHRAIGIGAPEDDLVRALGEPTRRGEDRVVYDCGETEQPVTFELASGRVTGISIEYYVD